MVSRQVGSSRRLVDRGIPFAGSLHSKSRSSPLLSVVLVLLVTSHADIKFPLPHRPKSSSLVIVSDALDYLSLKYLSRTLPDLARVSADSIVIFTVHSFFFCRAASFFRRAEQSFACFTVTVSSSMACKLSRYIYLTIETEKKRQELAFAEGLIKHFSIYKEKNEETYPDARKICIEYGIRCREQGALRFEPSTASVG
ncbi:hypothetical protein CRG98_047927 [Punica granatum]|uniref:Uncharacterized protein n=1 Tax=Punica granatum TaxID=22663 RepID=A0A2I0HJ06_PUNGR|nr:hypothetical protein CRG98_047927 [Punica granatum]